MPKKVTAWACKWGCGRRVTTKKKSCANHERQCIFNPNSRSCPTCRHDELEPDSVLVGSPDVWRDMMVAFCMIDERPENRACIKLCIFWEPKRG